jgi:hypothetical protein
MGASYYAYTVIGCEVTDKVRTKEIVGEGCAHNPSSYQAFCPTCGRSVRRESWVNAPGYESDDERIVHEGNKLEVVGTTDNKRLFAGVVLKVSSWDEKDRGAKMLHLEHVTLDQIADQVRSVLQPLGFWDSDNFGIWCVQHCSY